MSVPVYVPTPVAQGDGSPLQWKNCGCAAGASHLDRDTQGIHKTTGARVRQLTHDNVGGTTNDQIDSALREGWPPGDHMDSRRGEAFDDAVYEIASGRGASVSIGYSGGFAGTNLDGSPGFKGNHQIYCNEVRLVFTAHGWIDYEKSRANIYDPLWNARRAGIPTKKFRWIKLSILRQAAGALRMNSGRPLGIGRVYIGYTRVTSTPDTIPAPQPSPINFGANNMIVAGGLTLVSSHVVSVKKGQPFYREPKSTSGIVSKAADDHAFDYFGYGAPGWYSVLIVTGNFPDKVKRPTIVFCHRSAGSVSRKI